MVKYVTTYCLVGTQKWFCAKCTQIFFNPLFDFFFFWDTAICLVFSTVLKKFYFM